MSNRRKLTKRDLPAVKDRARQLSREIGSDEIKKSLSTFKEGVPFGYFDEDGALIGWKVVDPSTRTVVSSCGAGGSKGDGKTATAGPVAQPVQSAPSVEDFAPKAPAAATPAPKRAMTSAPPSAQIARKVTSRKTAQGLAGRPPAAPQAGSLARDDRPAQAPTSTSPFDALDGVDADFDYSIEDDEEMLYLSDDDDLAMMDAKMSAAQPVSARMGRSRSKDVPSFDEGDNKKKKRGAGKKILIALLVLALIAGCCVAAYKIAGGILEDVLSSIYTEETASEPDYSSYPQISANGIVHVQVGEGDTAEDVRLALCEAGMPEAARGFLSAVYGDDQQEGYSSLQAGDYIVRGDEGAADIARRMAAYDRVPDGVIGVNEGNDIYDIATSIADSNTAGVTYEIALVELENPYDYAAEFTMMSALPENLPSVEGFIPTGEYNIHNCANAHDVVSTLLAAGQTRYEASGLDPSGWLTALTKASLVEKEALFDEDRPLIASVIENRLAAGQLLQIDASVKYAVNSDAAVVTYDQTEAESPYNTYVVSGLPIGPICSGISDASLDAVLNPAQTDYMFYVLADKEGHHKFSTTAEEFAADKQAYLDLYGLSE